MSSEEEIPLDETVTRHTELFKHQLENSSDWVYTQRLKTSTFPNEPAHTVNPLQSPSRYSERERFQSAVLCSELVDVFVWPQLPHQREFHSLSDSE